MGKWTGDSFTEDEYKSKINSATGKPFGQASEEAVQGQAQDWRDKGAVVPATNEPKNDQSLAGSLFDWAKTPAGNATLAGLGMLGAAAVGLNSRRQGTPSSTERVEPYTAPSYDYETTAREVTERPGLPKPSTPAPTAQTTPAPTSGPTPNVPQPTYADPTKPVTPAVSGLGQVQPTYNQPTGVPNVGAAPPINIEAQPVPPTAKEIAAQNAERRAEELHQAKLEQIKAQTEAQRAKAAITKDTPSKAAKSAGGTISPTDAALLNNEIKGKAIAEAKAAQQKAIAEAVKPPAAAPVTSQPTAPVVVAPQAATPVAEAAVPPNAKPPKPPEKAPKAKLPMPEGWGKGMSWLVNQHGVEGAQDYINRYNDGKPFSTYDDMMKSYQENTMRPKYSDIPKDIRKSRGIAPPAQAGASLVPRTSLGSQQDLTQGGGAVLHMLNPLKL